MDSVLKFFYILAFIAFVVSVIAVALGFALWILSFVLIIGFTMPSADNFGYQVMVFSFKAIPYTVIIYLAVYLLRFIIEWTFLLIERGELKKDKVTNKNYLDVSSVVIKTKIVAMIVMAVTVAVLFVMAKLIAGDMESWKYAFLAIPVVAFIIYKIYSTKAFYRVQPQVQIIAEERHEKREQIKSEKATKREKLKTEKSEKREQSKPAKQNDIKKEQTFDA